MQTVNSELVIDRVDDQGFEEAQVAAVAFFARYNGRTLDAYRQDLRGFFDWAGIVGLEVLTATRGHIELYRQHMEQRALAASTIDRRLSTVCGFYRFAHIDGRITANPAQYVRRPKVHRAKDADWTAMNWAGSCSPPNASTGDTPPWRCYSG